MLWYLLTALLWSFAEPPNRNRIPTVFKVGAEPPKIHLRHLSSGLPVWILRDDRLPMVHVKGCPRAWLARF